MKSLCLSHSAVFLPVYPFMLSEWFKLIQAVETGGKYQNNSPGLFLIRVFCMGETPIVKLGENL